MPPWYPNGKSPFLKTLVFGTERPSFFRYRTPDDDSSKEPALVGELAAARLALRLQRFRADGCILNFDGAFSAENKSSAPNFFYSLRSVVVSLIFKMRRGEGEIPYGSSQARSSQNLVSLRVALAVWMASSVESSRKIAETAAR